jgi:Tfp pilus assembly protein PilV
MTFAVLRLKAILDARARSEHGFGMIELLASMTVMLVGILAVFAVFQAGIVQIRRASTTTTAAAIADSEMEKFRAIRYDSIGLANSDVAAADSTYTSDSAYKADNAPATTLASAMTASQLTISVASAGGFPSAAPYIVMIDSELILVSDGAGTTTWSVRDAAERGYLRQLEADLQLGVDHRAAGEARNRDRARQRSALPALGPPHFRLRRIHGRLGGFGGTSLVAGTR